MLFPIAYFCFSPNSSLVFGQNLVFSFLFLLSLFLVLVLYLTTFRVPLPTIYRSHELCLHMGSVYCLAYMKFFFSISIQTPNRIFGGV
jgi:hypothetical protein